MAVYAAGLAHVGKTRKTFFFFLAQEVGIIKITKNGGWVESGERERELIKINLIKTKAMLAPRVMGG